MMYSAWINEEEGVRELSDARCSGSRQGGGPGGGAPWLYTLEYQSTVHQLIDPLCVAVLHTNSLVGFNSRSLSP